MLGGGTYGDFLVQRGARLKVVLHNLPTEMTEPRLTQLLVKQTPAFRKPGRDRCLKYCVPQRAQCPSVLG